MKKVFVLFIFSIFITGCTAIYGNKAQYDKNDWYWFTGSDEIARIEQDRLALEKLKSQPIKTASINGVSRGYQGVVYNANRRRECDIRIYGPETKGFLVAPNMRDPEFLIPGKYRSQSCIEGECGEISKTFTVSAQTHRFFGQDVHWYVRCDKY